MSASHTSFHGPTTQDMDNTASLSIVAVCKFAPVANGHSILKVPPTNSMLIPDFDQPPSVGDPSAFMVFNNHSDICHPVNFDTGASLAITPDQSDFDGPLTIPKGDLRLRGMANNLKIDRLGAITWTFSNGAAGEVVVQGMACYVSKSEAWLLSPQRLLDMSTVVQG